MKNIELINSKIKEIEKRYNVQVIFAVDGGSNAYGYASPDSDIDLRFLYDETIESYLRLNREKDVIEIIDQNNDIEYKGFSLDKFMKLLSKSNPSILEWLNSPIIYFENTKYENIIKAIKELAFDYFSSKRCLFHYTGNAITDLKKLETTVKYNYDNNELLVGVGVKKLLSVYRELLICEYIVSKGSFPKTTDLKELIDFSEEVKELKDNKGRSFLEFLLFSLNFKKVQKKSELKELVMEKDFYDKHIEFFNKTINEYRNKAEKLKDKAIDFDKINSLYVWWVKEINS